VIEENFIGNVLQFLTGVSRVCPQKEGDFKITLQNSTRETSTLRKEEQMSGNKLAEQSVRTDTPRLDACNRFVLPHSFEKT